MRKPRMVLPESPHHVILRGNNKRRIFSHANDYYQFVRYLEEGLEKYACLMHSLVLMTNHVHMLVTPAAATELSGLIHLVSMKYAQYRNRVHNGTGKMFEERFKSFPILSDGQLAIVSAYIDLNPVRAGICDDPLRYRYSTYGLLV